MDKGDREMLPLLMIGVMNHGLVGRCCGTVREIVGQLDTDDEQILLLGLHCTYGYPSRRDHHLDAFGRFLSHRR